MALALLAAVVAVVPVESASANPPSVVVDHLATGYSVDRFDDCSSFSGQFFETVFVSGGGGFAVEAGTQVVLEVTFDRGIVIQPGWEAGFIEASLQSSGGSVGGSIGGAVIEVTGDNVAQVPVPAPSADFGGSAATLGFVRSFAFFPSAIVSDPSVIENPALPARIDGFRGIFTVPAGAPSGTGLVPRFELFVTQECDFENPGVALVSIPAPVNQPPVCDAAAPTVDTLWPPNHRLEAVNVTGLTDPEGDSVAVAIDSIFQDESVNGTGDGNTAPDGFGVGTDTAEVRAERTGKSNGRVYHIGFTADDGNGGTCSGEVLVGVPKSQGKKGKPAVDDGALFDSTAVP